MSRLQFWLREMELCERDMAKAVREKNEALRIEATTSRAEAQSNAIGWAARA